MAMDASDLMPNIRNPKRFKGGNNLENEDKISSLPDSLLHYILTFLPTKYAVGTSLLSTRWNSLWTSVSNLDLNDSQFHSKILCKKRDSNIFMNFVDRVLSLLDVPNIHKFSLVCDDIYDDTRVNTWISTIVKRKVQVLVLEMEFDNPCRFPYSLFTSDSLEILKIQSDSSFNIPAVVCFPNLKVLHLKFIKFLSGFKGLQVSITCPLLKEFVLQDCEWLEIKTVEIFAAELKKCVIDDSAYKGENGVCECQLKVYADTLVLLDLTSSLTYELCLYNTSLLVKASIHLSSHKERNPRASKILKGICNVKELILSDATVVIFARAELAAQLTAFSSLINLTVTVGLNDFFDEESELRVGQLINVLSHLPNVQIFRFTNGSEECAFQQRLPPRGRIQCLLPQLKSVELDCFYGDRNEFFFINFVVNNAKILETITIRTSLTLSEDPIKQKKVVKKLRLLPKSSRINLVGFSKELQI